MEEGRHCCCTHTDHGTPGRIQLPHPGSLSLS